ncbi:MAG: gliding motility-associated C-terminal domain-containing protein [Spirochaetia bacterium]|nr:gliding motility-associated C-terminal domain-containing protein [Spirochaetia bacterium]
MLFEEWVYGKIDNIPVSSRVRIYNVAGFLIFKAENVAGRVEWNGRNRQSRECAPGVYVYIIEAGGDKLKGKIYLTR